MGFVPQCIWTGNPPTSLPCPLKPWVGSDAPETDANMRDGPNLSPTGPAEPRLTQQSVTGEQVTEGGAGAEPWGLSRGRGHMQTAVHTLASGRPGAFTASFFLSGGDELDAISTVRITAQQMVARVAAATGVSPRRHSPWMRLI